MCEHRNISRDGKNIICNGFGAIFGPYAIVQDWAALSSVLNKLGHFDDKEETKWSSTKAEQIAALLSLFTFLEAGLIPANVKIFNVLDSTGIFIFLGDHSIRYRSGGPYTG